MRTIYRKALLLSLMMAFAIGTAMAQHGHEAMEVTPGSKGELPAVPDPPAAGQDGLLPILSIDHIYLTTYSGAYTYDYWLSFTLASVFEGEYYTLEYAEGENDNWVTWTDYEGYEYKFEEGNAVPPTNLSSKLRLRLHGGPKDGWVSNEVNTNHYYMRLQGCSVSWSTDEMPWQVVVGQTLKGIDTFVTRYNYSETESKKDFGPDCGYFKYQWYRRNPNTYELIPIKGATEKSYTVTIDDVGYQMVQEVTGDDEHFSAYQTHVFGDSGIPVCMPITVSLSYFNDGFIMNSEYVIPDPANNIMFENWDEETWQTVKVPVGNVVKEIKPGQYAFKMDRDSYEGAVLVYSNDTYYMTSIYMMPEYDENGELIGEKPTYREAQAMPHFSMRELRIKPLFNGEPVSTTIEILGKNMDGKLSTVATLSPEEASEGIFYTEVFKGKCFIKAHATDGTLETYYPDALVWSDAEAVEPIAADWSIEDWESTLATINMVKAPEPLQGTSVIEGTITVVGKARTRGGDSDTYTVYLKEKATGKIIAQTQTDASGNYKFENVPIGEYIVVPNIDGYKSQTTTPVVVAVTQENQTITDADCTMTEVSTAEIFNEPTEGKKGDTNGDGEVNVADVDVVIEAIGEDYETNKAADANSDGEINVADVDYIIERIE